MSRPASHKHTGSVSLNHKAQLANAYNELGKELSSSKIRVVGNYTLGKVIGEGAYGKVRIGTHRLTSTRVAIKQIPKAMSPSLTREIHHHRQLHHPHVTQMYEVIATESYIWIVTELCCGGELFDYLVEKGRLSEDETRIIFGQLCLAVAYLHENGIVHRDLKLENVLLDEHCRVKLGDFGFTREFEKGSLMDTYCGTTGYAAPEMLQGKKYQGPEVDVWSLGVILYCLLTGTLPFDDDSEAVMRDKIVKGEFEDPEWLSIESRDLIKNILVREVANRFTIPQILGHPWFKTHPHAQSLEPLPLEESITSSSSTASHDAQGTQPSDASASSAGSPLISSSSDLDTSAPTTPDEVPNDPFEQIHSIHRNPSETTIRKATSDFESIYKKMSRSGKPETVHEEEDNQLPKSIPPRKNSSGSSLAPPALPTRTPARTKRRSVSSTLSDPASPTDDKPLMSLPFPVPGKDLDFASLLNAPMPIIFSTPLERELLNTLSTLGFDTAQIVHSVLTDACDSAGAVWWMLKKKAERRHLEGGAPLPSAASVTDEPGKGKAHATHPHPHKEKEKDKDKDKRRRVHAAVQTDHPALNASLTRSAPQLAFVPPTPTFARPVTPPRPATPTRSSMLSPSTSTIVGGGEGSSKSHPSTPAGSLKEKETKARKARAGSVSIMQRATTALEAAGLVRKKSSEAVKEEKEKEKEREKERSRDMERRMASGDEPRSSHGSGGSSRLTKSPPLKATKDYNAPSTPPPNEAQPQQGMGSPWVLADDREGASSHQRASSGTPSKVPEMQTSVSAPAISTPATIKPTTPVPQRNRANLLTAFRLWFNDERKGKRKDTSGAPSVSSRATFGRSNTQVYNSGTAKRRGSNSSGRFGTRIGHRQRTSVSSRRSSSVNSRRSSGASQMMVLDSPQLPTRRSIGSHTPNSDLGEYSSRPSSIRSFSMQRHRKSPSASSAGSAHFARTASPMQKYHRRAGSGSSSTTRVVRQASRTPHLRSNSTTSSLHSPPSSRPTSFYEASESEAPRTASPYKPRARRSFDDTPRRTASGGNGSGGASTSTFVAQKRSGPFASPITHGFGPAGGSVGRSSWKKSWGLEPPGWQTRTAHLPVEVLAVSPATEPASIRDVFSGRHSISMGDESDWVDEDDDVPAFAGGLGQMGIGVPAPPSSTLQYTEQPVMLSPAPRRRQNNKRSTRNTSAASSMSSRQKVESTPSENVFDLTEPRAGRRSLPAGRSGPAFRHAIQEEDEDEEE